MINLQEDNKSIKNSISEQLINEVLKNPNFINNTEC